MTDRARGVRRSGHGEGVRIRRRAVRARGTGWHARRAGLIASVAAAAFLTACGAQRPERLTVEVLAELPHDAAAFTQGLQLGQDGKLYESTGLVGRSSVREVARDSGAVIRQRDIPAPYFAEGLTLVGDEVLQLTWQAGLAFRWNRTTFEPTGHARYEGEGWGLCFDGEALWMSDGSATLTRRDPSTFAVLDSVEVRAEGEPLARLNELECVDDVIYANVWLTDEIVRIDPGSGRVTARIDAEPLRASLGAVSPDAVLNGIAYDAQNDTFLVTGKLWPKLYEVRFVKDRR
ncbi:MAG: glutaminyl-peptide cyclotransferase [Trueperaceae bacterium]